MAKRVRLVEPIKFNLTGYDREALEFAAGEHDAAPDELASFLEQNPELGEILGDGEPAVAAGSAVEGPESVPPPKPARRTRR